MRGDLVGVAGQVLIHDELVEGEDAQVALGGDAPGHRRRLRAAEDGGDRAEDLRQPQLAPLALSLTLALFGDGGEAGQLDGEVVAQLLAQCRVDLDLLIAGARQVEAAEHAIAAEGDGDEHERRADDLVASRGFAPGELAEADVEHVGAAVVQGFAGTGAQAAQAALTVGGIVGAVGSRA